MFFDPLKPDDMKPEGGSAGAMEGLRKASLREPLAVQARDKLFRWLAGHHAPALDQRISAWAGELREQGSLPLRLSSWSGREWLLCERPEVKVSIKLCAPEAIPRLLRPSLSNLGQAYVEGLIDVDGEVQDIVDMAHALARRKLRPEGMLGRVVRHDAHAPSDDRSAIEHHYDVSNEFYKLWLDPEMVYSCAYYESGHETLAEAQLRKLDHILSKVRAGPNDRLLDIGCGWGALVIRAAQKYGCRCTGVTLSARQHAYATERVRSLGLSDRITVLLQDYRDVQGAFERITSVGMFEHVGVENLPSYFSKIASLLRDDGVALNHGITSSDVNDGQTAFGGGDFISRYVFPGGELAHISTVLKAMQEGGLEAWDVESLRRHYARTLRDWTRRFETHAGKIRALVGEKRYRIWRVYLMGSAQAFERDEISLFQVVAMRAGQSAAVLPWSRREMYAERAFVG